MTTTTDLPVTEQVNAALDEIQHARAAATAQPASAEQCLQLAELADIEAAWWEELSERSRTRVYWRAALAAREHAQHTARYWRARATVNRKSIRDELIDTRPGGSNRQERAHRVGAPAPLTSNEGNAMLRRQVIPPPAEPPLQLVLTCGDQNCQHTFEPDPLVFATGSLVCPVCGGWTFHAALAEPDSPAPGGDR